MYGGNEYMGYGVTADEARAKPSLRPKLGFYRDRRTPAYIYYYNPVEHSVAIVASPAGTGTVRVTPGTTAFNAIFAEIMAVGKPNATSADIKVAKGRVVASTPAGGSRSSFLPSFPGISPAQAATSVTDVPPAFYQQPWFLPAIVLGVVVLGGGLVLARR